MNNSQYVQPNGDKGSLFAQVGLAILVPLLLLAAAILGLSVKATTGSLLAAAAVVAPIFGFAYWLGKCSRIAKAASPNGGGQATE